MSATAHTRRDEGDSIVICTAGAAGRTRYVYVIRGAGARRRIMRCHMCMYMLHVHVVVMLLLLLSCHVVVVVVVVVMFMFMLSCRVRSGAVRRAGITGVGLYAASETTCPQTGHRPAPKPVDAGLSDRL